MSFYTPLVGFNGNLYLPLAGGTMSGGIAVATDNAIDLGAGAANWRGLYVRNISSNAALAVDAAAGITIGGTNATGVTVGRAATTTQINGKLRYDTVGAATVATAGTIVINVAGVDYKLQLYT